LSSPYLGTQIAHSEGFREGGEMALSLANQVFEACGERGIVLMPLKGVLLLARWPALRGRRDLVDVDLLVRSSDVEALTFALHTLGFEATATHRATGAGAPGAESPSDRPSLGGQPKR
jgi:hypothetical protein